MKDTINIFWFRRDLRLDDNVGFFNALKGKHLVLPIFIFDTEILEELPCDDARISFIHKNLKELNHLLSEHNSGLAMYFGNPLDIFKQLILKYDVRNVISNRDYEPYARQRDIEITQCLTKEKIGFYTFKDQVIFEKDDIVKKNGEPYVVYTPFMKQWKTKYRTENIQNSTSPEPVFSNLIQSKSLPQLSLDDIGFKESKITMDYYKLSEELIEQYENLRNLPGIDATSRLGPHLRFGTVSIRKLMKFVSFQKNEVFWQELIWREFFMQILWHFPDTVHKAFRKKYDRIDWRNDEIEFEAWKNGKTGYPLVDAGMNELNETGFMHNRVRMVVASFLCKHLLIDWRWGEAYFAEKLLDYEQSSNVGNWQWAAGSGVDAAPYFRIFNPTTQLIKFDKDLSYVQKWVKNFRTETYPDPIVEHKKARERCLHAYKLAVS